MRVKEQDRINPSEDARESPQDFSETVTDIISLEELEVSKQADGIKNNASESVDEDIVEEDTSLDITSVISKYGEITVLDNIESIEKKSPFAYYKGMRYNCTKNVYSKSAISTMIHKAEISQTDSLILEALGQYTYLNSYMIRTHIYYSTAKKVNLSREKCRSILKHMLSRGLVLQYELHHKEEGVEQGSAFIYALSIGGEMYCNYLGVNVALRRSQRRKEFTIPTLLSTLAINQFHIMMEARYTGLNIVKRSDIYKKAYVSTNVAGDYAIFLPDHTLLNMYLTGVRNTEDMSETFIHTLGRLAGYVAEIRCGTYFLLVICETEHQVLECERLRICNGMSKIPVLYTTDTTIATNKDVFERLIRVEDIEKGEKTYIKLNL